MSQLASIPKRLADALCRALERRNTVTPDGLIVCLGHPATRGVRSQWRSLARRCCEAFRMIGGPQIYRPGPGTLDRILRHRFPDHPHMETT